MQWNQGVVLLGEKGQLVVNRGVPLSTINSPKHYADFGAFCPEVYDAEVRISIEGKPLTLGIACERAMGGKKIWFVRI